MFKIVAIAVLLSIGTVFPAAAQTQLEMNENAKSGYTRADKELNLMYQRVQRNTRKTPSFLLHSDLRNCAGYSFAMRKCWPGFRSMKKALTVHFSRFATGPK